jgi:hypothetical protein
LGVTAQGGAQQLNPKVEPQQGVTGLMKRSVAWDPFDPVEAERFGNFHGRAQMSGMHGIESSAENQRSRHRSLRKRPNAHGFMRFSGSLY